ncbi:CLAVATA3/ESR (CLE)-related protein 16 [Citrus sinensis]|uniref:CLAVATA3/ESR (CLE)-related protein 16 n=3 Tax=Citrus TaxID=2706 RepID=A0ACB8N9X1_CITSI|nr:hypothetical protein CICLE_v10017256mg [Citrus x clementina]KAH9746330.1 CLAVATA3/ESR (CLE)-related protein 16 [Citrus sinensis]KAH9794693.1 CLAVATA3/ESR (CLE)-related protein 16 [Citrus sinensis]
MQMTVPRDVVSARGRRRRCAGAKAASFFFWVILIFSLLGLLCALHDDETGTYSSFSARKTRSFNTESTFHAPPPSISGLLVDTEADNPGSSVYEDDKRIIHTGPNPLHN